MKQIVKLITLTIVFILKSIKCNNMYYSNNNYDSIVDSDSILNNLRINSNSNSNNNSSINNNNYNNFYYDKLNNKLNDLKSTFSNVSCFWINTSNFTMWDVSPLKRQNDTDLFIDTPRGKLTYNFCDNTLLKCKDQTSQAIGTIEPTQECELLSGNASDFNGWRMRNDDNLTEGVIIAMNYGEKCKDNPSEEHNVIWNLRCDDKLEQGVLKVTNQDRIDIGGCKVYIEADTYHGKYSY